MKGADSSDWLARAGSALLLALVLAAPGGAQQGGDQPPPEEETDVLDWLGGSAEPAPPTPPDPLPPVPQAGAEDPLDWLAGESPAAPERAAAEPAPGAEEETGNKPVYREASAAALACADKLRQAMALELQVQEYESRTLGAEAAAGELRGFKKQVWDRVQRDRAGFRQLAGQMSLQALDFPQPAPGVSLSRDGIALLAALDREYEASRNPRTLDQYIELNKGFLKSADNSQRTRAVTMREELVAREVTWTSLSQQAVTLAKGEGDEALVTHMREVLQQVAPSAEAGSDDLAVLVLSDPALRQQVMSEVTAVLTAVQPPPPLPAPDAELRPRVLELQVKLAEMASLPPLIEEHAALTEQLEKVDAQLDLDLPLDRRKDLVATRTDLLTRRNQVEVQWYGSQPDPETWEELADAQDELISRRMLDLGSAGVLYGARVEALRAVRDDGLPDTRSHWEYVEQQQEMILLLDRIQPEDDPLRSAIMPDLWGMALMKEAQEKAALEKELLAKSAPKPVAKKPAPAKKPGMKPKPKAMPPKKGGKGMKPY